MGPAGSGKSTYCDTIRQHCENIKRTVHVVNLDPAAEQFNYPVSIDIKELVVLEDVMQEFKYGPNGGLIFCMEYLMQNLDWLQDELADYEDDYLIIDCPGQIELYSHVPVMRNLVDSLQRWGYSICALYLIDSQFISDPAKFISGTLMALSAMIYLEVPHINVLTKMDLVNDTIKKSKMEKFFDPDITELVNDLTQQTGEKFLQLNEAIGSVIEDYKMVNFLPLDISDEESITDLLAQIDNALQYGEDLEVVEHRELDEQEEESADVDNIMGAFDKALGGADFKSTDEQ